MKFSTALIPLLFLILLLAAISLSRLFYPYDVGHFEACTWTPALLSARGENPYAFATREPYVMAPYGYAHYLLVGAGFRVFGLQFWFGSWYARVLACCLNMRRSLPYFCLG